MVAVHQQVALGRVLLTAIHSMSLRSWQLEWAPDVEYHIWRIGKDNRSLPTPENTVEKEIVSIQAANQPADLLVLAEVCGGWWTWEDGPVFVPLSEWDLRYDAWVKGESVEDVAQTNSGETVAPGHVAAPLV